MIKTKSAAQKAWETRRANITAKTVIDALVTGKRDSKSILEFYVQKQVEQRKEESRVRAAIKAHVTRRTAI